MSNNDQWTKFAFFALLGLGVSVRISHCYHSFMAGIVSHCTPTPISIVNYIVSTHTGNRTVVGWGGGGNEKRRNFFINHGTEPVPRLTKRFLKFFGDVSKDMKSLALLIINIIIVYN